MTASHVWSALISIPVLQIFRLIILSLPYTRQVITFVAICFFCADDEIRYPLYEDTIPSETMFTIFFFTALILVTTVEYTLIRHLTKTQRRMVAHDKSKGVHPGLLNIFFFMISLSCSTLATSVIINLGKRTANRLRPNFLAVCQPNLTELCPPNTFSYIEDYLSIGACSAFCSIWSLYDLLSAERCKFPQPLRSFIQFIIFLFVYFICLSRVHDHKHRLSDVAGGALIGLGTGTFFMCFVLRHFKSTATGWRKWILMNLKPYPRR
uniref:Phosphatidic acid phosphatase type 2/haloperoxidase domain-containing protein n=1 Tax=Ditylenchus dipsaci TaxID=166011 RepID=A0A915CSH2_9BILA